MLVKSGSKTCFPGFGPRRLPCRWTLMLGLALAWPVPGRALGASGPDKLDFNFEVRPILADRCFKCHGPDAKARKAKLRLDQPESAYAIRDPQTGKRAIVPRHPEQSELYRRITTKDNDDRCRQPPAISL